MSELPPCHGAMNNKGGCLVLCSRRGLLAYVYSGVSLTMNALVAGNGSYIVRLSVRDLHGSTVRTSRLLAFIMAVADPGSGHWVPQI